MTFPRNPKRVAQTFILRLEQLARC
jgi:hypothetical protein